MENQHSEVAGTNGQRPNPFRVVRQIVLVVLTVVSIGYVVAVPCGLVKEGDRLQVAEIALIGVLVIASSTLLERLGEFSFGSEGVSARFDKVEDSQRQMETQLDEQATNLEKQQSEIRSLQVALRGIVTQYEHDKLVGLAGPDEETFMCYYSDDLFNELKRLRSMNFVANFEGAGLTTIKKRYKDSSEQFNLKDFFYIREEGREYLKLRDEIHAAEENEQ